VGCSQILNILKNPNTIGYDFARYGGDENVVYRRRGLAIVEQAIFPRGVADPNEAVAAGFRMQHEAKWSNKKCWHIVDAHGMGQGVLRQFYRANKQIFEFYNNSGSTRRDFADRITEAWFQFAKLTKRRIVHMPNDPQLIQQLTSRQYHVDGKGKLAIESKENYLKRRQDKEKEEGSTSPDRADALVLAFYDETETKARVSRVRMGSDTVGRSHR